MSNESRNPITPPNNAEVERMTLGNILLDPSCLQEILSILGNAQAFYHPIHSQIFSAMCAVSHRGSPVDIGTVAAELRTLKKYNTVGGLQALGELTDCAVSTANFRAHARIVRQHADERAVMVILRDALAVLQHGPEHGSKLSALTQARVLLNTAMERALDPTARGPVSFAHLAQEWAEGIERSLQSGGVPGVSTGVRDLDELTGGWRPGQLIICGARPAMGKTAYSLLAAETAAKKDGAVLIVSMEMGALDLLGRCAGKAARVDSSKLNLGRISQSELEGLYAALEELAKLPIEIDDSPSMTLLDVATSAARVKAKYGSLSLIVVDYLQLMQSHGADTREQAVAELSRGLKRLAKELRVPILVLAQLNRGLESREDKRPRLSDLRESGSIEQDADVAMFMYRDEVYNKNSSDKGVVEFIVAKQRNGATDTVKAKWTGSLMRFDELTQQAPADRSYDPYDSRRDEMD